MGGKRRPIEALDPETGAVVESWPSIRGAVADGGYCDGGLNRVLSGQRKTYRGLEWRYASAVDAFLADDAWLAVALINLEKASVGAKLVARRQAKRMLQGLDWARAAGVAVPVTLVHIRTGRVVTWPSHKMASLDIGCAHTAIAHVTAGRRRAIFGWRLP